MHIAKYNAKCNDLEIILFSRLGFFAISVHVAARVGPF